MNWGREALDLYEKNLNKVGKIEYRGEIPYTLLPTFHSTATAQITVTIDEEGNFLHGEQVPANDKFTIIPVTEKSGSRTSGKEAHPLCDNLRYLAGDYPLYVADDGSCFEIYMEQLKKWYESEFCHDKVRAIYYYLQKKSLMHDLIEQKVLKQNEDGKTVAAMDCLVPGIGEIIGGSQREDDYTKLTERMKELGLNEEDYGFYLDLRKYGSARHAGFGLGFERCVMYLTGMGNIRDVIPFPRTVNNCDI